MRCPITAQGQWLWRELEILYRDPDSAANGARIRVELKRLHQPPGSVVPVVVETLAAFRTYNRGSDPAHVNTARVGIGAVLADFATATYWLEISMSRDALAVPSPRVYSVRLRYVPSPP